MTPTPFTEQDLLEYEIGVHAKCLDNQVQSRDLLNQRIEQTKEIIARLRSRLPNTAELSPESPAAQARFGPTQFTCRLPADPVAARRLDDSTSQLPAFADAD